MTKKKFLQKMLFILLTIQPFNASANESTQNEDRQEEQNWFTRGIQWFEESCQTVDRFFHTSVTQKIDVAIDLPSDLFPLINKQLLGYESDAMEQLNPIAVILFIKENFPIRHKEHTFEWNKFCHYISLADQWRIPLPELRMASGIMDGGLIDNEANNSTFENFVELCFGNPHQFQSISTLNLKIFLREEKNVIRLAGFLSNILRNSKCLTIHLVCINPYKKMRINGMEFFPSQFTSTISADLRESLEGEFGKRIVIYPRNKWGII